MPTGGCADLEWTEPGEMRMLTFSLFSHWEWTPSGFRARSLCLKGLPNRSCVSFTLLTLQAGAALLSECPPRRVSGGFDAA